MKALGCSFVCLLDIRLDRMKILTQQIDRPSSWRSLWRIFLWVLIVCLSIPLLFYQWLQWQRPSPIPIIDRPLFAGVTYSRIYPELDVPVQLHVIRIDLTASGVSFTTTPSNGDAPLDTDAQTVRHFLEKSGSQVAINGSFFDPFHSRHPFDYYPHAGDPVNVQGYTMLDGELYSDDYRTYAILCLDGAQATFRPIPPCPVGTQQAITGHQYLLRAGQIYTPDDYSRARHPRTAVGLDETGETMWWFVADGRQAGYSEGMTMLELIDVAQALGVTDLLGFDGGGSSTLVYETADGGSDVLNVPIHTRLPGRERPVANHIGLYADSLIVN